MSGGTVTLTKNPYLGDALLDYFVKRLRDAKTPKEWRWPVDMYKGIVAALDRYIADLLTARGRAAEGESSRPAGGWRRRSARCSSARPTCRRYARSSIRAIRSRTPGSRARRTSAQGIPLFLYREDDEWHLVDVTTPHQVKVNSERRGDTYPPDELFYELNTKLRFPRSSLYWRLPGDKRGRSRRPSRRGCRVADVDRARGGAVALAIVTPARACPP